MWADELNRLVREDNQQISKTVTYEYDTGGNILNKKEYAYTTGTLGEVVDTITYTYDSTWKDKLLTYDGGATITYDEIGNPLTYNGYTFTWQKGRQLASASGNGNTITYKYGADGLRTEKTVNGVTTQYTYLSGQLVAQTDGANTLTFAYTADGIPRTVNYNGTDYYYLYNLQGDVIAIYDRNGNTRVKYVYDSWGKIISVSGTLATTLGTLNPFRYRGYVYDTETGFYYLTTRYYDPDTGRFLNADGYISTGYAITGFNMFAYCGCEPVKRIDPTGTRYFECCPYSNCAVCRMSDPAVEVVVLTPIYSTDIGYLETEVSSHITKTAQSKQYAIWNGDTLEKISMAHTLVDTADYKAGFSYSSSTFEYFSSHKSGIYDVQVGYGIDTDELMIKYDITVSEEIDEYHTTGFNINFSLDVVEYIQINALAAVVATVCIVAPKVAFEVVVSSIPRVVGAFA